MKKNFISKLLMAALVVVTMGVFSSCKDYDDDINANTALINQLQSQVKALEEARASLENQLSAANTAIQKAQGDATLALSQIEQAKKDLSDAIAKGDEANAQEIEKLSGRINTLETELKQYAKDQATAAVEAAVTKYQLDKVAELITKVQELDKAMADRYTKKEIDDKLANYVTSKDFEDAVKAINTEISGLRTDLQANADADKIVADKLDEIYSRAIKGGDIDQAIALVASDLSSFKEGINKIINEDEAKEKAGFATLTALQAANKQIEANGKAIEELQGWTKNFDENVLPTLATVEALNKAVADLKILIDQKADQTALEEAVSKINETIETLATKAEVVDAINGIKELLAKDYVTNSALETALAKLSGEITSAYKAYTAEQFEAFRGELAGIIQTAITTNNAALKQEIYGEVDSKIATALANYVTNSSLETKLAQYTTTQSLMAILADYSTKADVTDEINKFYNEKLKDKMTEIDIISAQLASMDQAFVELAEELAALNDFDVDKPANGRANSATSGIAALKNLLAAMCDKIVNIHQYVEQSIQDVNDKLDVFVSFANKNLTSIVTKPSEWLYGLPKIDATVVAEQPVYTLETTAATENKPYTERYESNSADAYSFAVTAQYWMNPSTFDKDLYDYQFEELPTKSIITRAEEEHPKDEWYDKAGTTIDKVTYSVADGGVLTVLFHFNDPEYVNNALTHYENVNVSDNHGEEIDWITSQVPSYAWTTSLALKATRKANADETALPLDVNRVVTSDYAIVAPSYLTNLLLVNNKYASTNKHEESNILWHLNTDGAQMSGYEKTVAEDGLGKYSFSLQRDKKIDAGENVGYINLDNNIFVHYTEQGSEEEQWTNAEARLKGFTFRYTIVPNGDEVYFNQTGDNGEKISVDPEKGNKASAAGHVAIIRCELIANNNVYAYGYVSILITNTKVTTEIDLPELVLDCNPALTGANGFTTSVAWADLIAKIKAALGTDFNEEYYKFILDGTNLKKFDNSEATTASTKLGDLKHDGNKLAWSFTKDQAKTAFYTGENPNPAAAPYVVWIRIEPTDEGIAQGKQEIIVKVTIPSVKYPSGEFKAYDGDESEFNAVRLKQAWFGCQSPKTDLPVAQRYETHANVETLGQRGWDNTGDAADKLIYDMSSAFKGNKFIITPDKGFTFAKEAQAYFDWDKYTHYYGGTPATEFCDSSYFKGASGAEYCLYLTGPKDLKLKAAKKVNGNYDFANGQVVVDLSMTHDWNLYNNVAEFQGYQDPVGGEFARDLLNHAGHKDLAKGETFTTHMVLHQYDYCLPIDERGNNKFDIRWLRPVSAIGSDKTFVYDARNDGNYIWVADLVNFIEWRNHEFSASTTKVKAASGLNLEYTGYDYMRYYGVTTIKANFELAKTNFNGGSLDNPAAWPLITALTSKMKFEPDANAKAINEGGTADQNTPAWTDDYSETKNADTGIYETGFKAANGYYLYENNSGVVGEFYIYLPVSVVYDWGETEPEWILIKVFSTEGQARRF